MRAQESYPVFAKMQTSNDRKEVPLFEKRDPNWTALKQVVLDFGNNELQRKGELWK